MTPSNPKFGSSTTLEILMEIIVFGGLDEFIASLSIVISSASSNVTTLNILVLSLANMTSGLFSIIYEIWKLKPENGESKYFYLHAVIAILSFIIFGLVSPLVYVFTFTESNNKDLKLVAVAVASVICITLLSIAKARVLLTQKEEEETHAQRPKPNLTYLMTLFRYILTGAVAFSSYLVGESLEELIEKRGWFDTKSSSFALLLPEMSSEKPRFGSY